MTKSNYSDEKNPYPCDSRCPYASSDDRECTIEVDCPRNAFERGRLQALKDAGFTEEEKSAFRLWLTIVEKYWETDQLLNKAECVAFGSLKKKVLGE